MKIIDVVQGSPEWNDLRAKHHTASEAPVMAAASKQMKRNDLLKAKYTGESKEVNWWVQRFLFDKGHAAEASARPIAEELVGEELYPVTGISEEHPHLLASLDGCTMLEDVIFEHKLWNAELAAAVEAGNLDDHYTVQMDQQLLVSGAEKCLFMVSDGTRENCVWCWYERDENRFDKLLAGWKQFDVDLKAYQPTDEVVKPEGQAPESLPALTINLTGGVQASNLPDFKAAALAMIEGIKTELKTDQDFSDAEATVKWLQKGEKQLKASKQSALEQTSSIDALFRTIDDLSEQMRQKRLTLDKLVAAEKTNRRNEIQRTAENAYDAHLGAVEKDLEAACVWPIRFPAPNPDIAGAMKGKRTISSLQDAADTAVAHAKIEADEIARRIRSSIDAIKQEADGFESLFADGGQLVVTKAPDDIRNLVRSRIAEHKEAEQKRLEAERERIRREEEQRAKAKAEEEALQAEQARQQQEKAKAAEDARAAREAAQPAPDVREEVVTAPEENSASQSSPIDTSRLHAAADSFQRASQIDKPDEVTIPRKVYEQLLSDQKRLHALEDAGVAHWSRYAEAIEKAA